MNTATLVLEQEHRLTLPFEETNMVIRSTQSIVDRLLQNHVLIDSRVAYSSVIIGILACKMVYGLSRMIGPIYFKSYSGLPKCGMEYVIHHLLSVVGVSYAMLTGEAQVYTYMVLISEATTPWINLRWYLDEAGMKNSRVYLTNGIIIFLAWLVARILLFVYLFYHTYVHYDQVKQMHASGVALVLVVPFIISVMNLVWFGKIFKGLKKTLAKRKKSQ